MTAIRPLQFTFVLLLGAAVTVSAEQLPTTVDRYVIDAEHTHVAFHVERFGFAKTMGVFPDSTGVLTHDPTNPQRSNVNASVKVDTVWTGSATRDEHVRGEHWLDAAQYPELSFSSDRIEQSQDDQLRVAGQLTLWGQARPVTFDVSINKVGGDPSRGKAQALGFSARVVIKRSDFGHTLASSLIGDEVEITIEGLAHRSE